MPEDIATNALQRRIPWPATALAIAMAAIFLYALGRLDQTRAGLFEETLFLPGSYGTPVLTLSPPQPPYRGGVLLIHGYGGSKEMMQGLAMDLAREGFYTFCLDLPGAGDSSLSFSRDQLYPALETAYLDLLGRALLEPDRVAVVGHSMGGGLADRLARERREIRATVLISSSPQKPDGEPLRNVLLLAAENDLPGPRQAMRRYLTTAYGGDPPREGITAGDFKTGTARRALTIGGANHLTVLYARQARMEVRDWLRAVFELDSPAAVLPERNSWILTAHLASLLLFAPLMALFAAIIVPVPNSFAVEGLGSGRFFVTWAVACTGGSLLAAVSPVRPGIGIHLADFVAWALAGAALLAWFSIRVGKLHVAVGRRPDRNSFLLAAIGFLAIYLPVLKVADSEWLRFSLNGRWSDMGLAALLIFPAYLFLESYLRACQREKGLRRSILMGWAAHALLLAALLLPVYLPFGRVDRFLLMMGLPFLGAFFLIFPVLGAFLYRSTKSVWCTSLWNAALYGWLLTATLFRK